jgi:hypothetical protein
MNKLSVSVSMMCIDSSAAERKLEKIASVGVGLSLSLSMSMSMP